MTSEPDTHSSAADSVENRYYAYLRGKGYSSTQALLDVLGVYLPYLEGYRHVADLGCGHGEMMRLLAQRGHRVSGVDVDPAMVDACRAAGLDVELGDAVAWLDARPGALDAVFSSNVIEHLPAQTVAAWIAAAYRALRPGGLLLFATPNPESVVVQLHEFWRDPTHVRLYSRQLLEFFLADAGFEQVRSHENPSAAWEGVDIMLQGLLDDLPPAAVKELPAALEPKPVAADPNSTRWHKFASWLALLVHAKLTSPFIEPLRVDLQRQLDVLHAHSEALVTLQERIRRLATADRYLYPSREILVVGNRPAQGAPAAARTAA